MTVLAKLTEEEEALAWILLDPTGAEIYEFVGVFDEEGIEEPARLWDWQWPYTHCESEYQTDALARGLGKSVSVGWKAMAFVFQHPGLEMLVVCPELNHLELLTSKIEQVFSRYRLLREMRPKNATGGIKKAPHWQMTFVNHAQIITRLASRPSAMKGPHPIFIEGDEDQDWPIASFLELIETVKTHLPGFSWRMHGVSKGVGRDLHYMLTQGLNKGARFYVHHYIAAHRPTWTDAERTTKIAQYGGDESHPDYQRNILGLPADSGNTLFVTARLMSCVRMTESAWATEYNDEVYSRIKISDVLADRVGAIENLVDIPISHFRDEYRSYWGGADIGFTNDPTEILIFGTTKAGVDRLLLRVRLERISAPDQVRVIQYVFRTYGPRLKRFGMDRTGVGLPLWQDLQLDQSIAGRIAGYNYSENRVVAFEDREQRIGETLEDLAIKRNIKDASTDMLRRAVDQKRLELPYDDELLKEWQGATSYIVKTSKDDDGVRRRYGGGSLHTLDAGRMYIAAKELMVVEEMLAGPVQRSVLDAFF